MSQAENTVRLNKVTREFNLGLHTIVDFLAKKGIDVDASPNAKISEDTYALLTKEFGNEQSVKDKEAAKKVIVVQKRAKEEEEPHEPTPLIIKDTSVFTLDKPVLSGTKATGAKIDVETAGKGSKKAADKVAADKVAADKVKEQAPKKQKEETPEQPKAAQPEVEQQQQQQQQQEKAEHKETIPPQEKSKEEPQPTVAPQEAAPEVKQTAAPEVKQEVKQEAAQEVKPQAEIQKAKQEAAPQEVKEAAQEAPEAHPVAEPPQAAPEKVAAEDSKTSTIAAELAERGTVKVVGKIDLDALAASSKRSRKRKRGSKNQEKRGKDIAVAGKPEKAPVSRPATPVSRPTTPVAHPATPAKGPEILPVKKEIEFIPTKVDKLEGPKFTGEKIDLSLFRKEDVDAKHGRRKGKRKRIKGVAVNVAKEGKEVAKQQHEQHKKETKKKNKRPFRQEVNAEDVDKQIKDTLAKMLEKNTKHKVAAKHRRDKREAINLRMQEEMEQREQEKQILRLSEFVTANDLSRMMDISVNEVIGACMNLGLMVSINQRLDAEAIALIAENFGHQVEFVTADTQGIIEQEEDKPEDLLPRPPIVTVMGHVDHGKTSLLDNIRNSNVIAGEAGGITQHIGAYHVELGDGRVITFLDTPGHEAFTAMRARGAQITDVAIIVVAADDSVMPQTIEAINHAVAAGVPMIFAINKIDKPGANPDRIREQLSAMNYLVEDWGGKYQVQEISAKQGINVDKLLEKVLLEADMLELKANPNKRAQGAIIESLLDKGRGYVSRMLVHNGTLHVGDVILSGQYTGRVKAMYNERGNKITVAYPSTPVEILGLNGAPTAGETFNVMPDEREAREIANKREQLKREQGLRTQKHITLDEIGRRLAIGNFKDLNIIVKADVDGSVEALTDALLKLSTEQVQVNVIHKAVGAVSESDVHLAVASEAIIVGFQVRPSAATRKLAEQEEIEVRTYSIIYDAINEIKDAIEGMRAPEYKEEVVCSVEVLQVFRVTKVGTVAGCIVREGKITRSTKVRVIRDGIVLHDGELASLKRFKDDVKEVTTGFDCGLNLANFNDVKEKDIIEGYENVLVKR
ncbi:MAG: translation initiation factor IF-2 [Prevotellaceae bacterium]|jgi:translation initiation factor IF-2|nr:translation initiation factor IF-2 [Prevotellaceae bacterium]